MGNDFRLVNDSTIVGTYYTKGWAEHHQMSYILRLSTPADSIALYRDGERQRLSAGFAVERDTADLSSTSTSPRGAHLTS